MQDQSAGGVQTWAAPVSRPAGFGAIAGSATPRAPRFGASAGKRPDRRRPRRPSAGDASPPGGLDREQAITIRSVSDKVRAERAARSHRSQEFLRNELVERASRPSIGNVISGARARVAATRTRLASAQ